MLEKKSSLEQLDFRAISFHLKCITEDAKVLSRIAVIARESERFRRGDARLDLRREAIDTESAVDCALGSGPLV